MIIDPDFSEISEKLPDGTYEVEVVDYKQKIAKMSGNPYLEILLSICAGESTGLHIYHTTPLKGRGAILLRQLLSIVNPVYRGGSFDGDDLLGKKFFVTVRDKKFPDGTPKRYPSVVSVAATGSG